MTKYTKQEITKMADRCYHRCWHCDRYEPTSGIGSGSSNRLFNYAGSGCYEAHDLPWEKGHWCPFWGNKKHPDAKILRSLTWDNVVQYTFAKTLESPYELREKILTANPEIAQQVQYCDNSNESRDQYFNKSENHALLCLDNFNIYCETLRRYRFSHVDNRALYPGANEWIRPIMIAFDPKSYKSLSYCMVSGDGPQISFACSPDKNYILNDDIFFLDEEKQEMIAEFRNRGEIIERFSMPVANIGKTR